MKLLKPRHVSLPIQLSLVLALLIIPNSLLARVLEGGFASGYPGWIVTVPVQLNASNGTVGIQNELYVDGVNVWFLPKPDGRPDCNVNSSIDKNAYFSFLPFGCRGADCYGIRATVLALDDLDPMPSTALYSCKIVIGLTTAPGTYIVYIGSPTASSNIGVLIPISSSTGAVTVNSGCSGCGCS